MNQLQALAKWCARDVVALFILGISSGLPILLVFGTLSAWLREAGVERATIGFLSWAGLSYGFKFIWAPLVDHLKIPLLFPLLGKRRSWMLLSQLMVIGAIIWMASFDPSTAGGGLMMLAIGAVVLGFSSATQDVVIDAYRIDIAPDDKQALLAGVAIAGYRMGMVFGGAGVLELSQIWGSSKEFYVFSAWQSAFWIMALLMLVGVMTTLLIREPTSNTSVSEIQTNPLRLLGHFMFVVFGFVLAFFGLLENLSIYLKMPLSLGFAAFFGWLACTIGVLDEQEFYRIYISPFTDFFQRYGQAAILFLLVICLYRTSDIVMGVMAKVFYIDMGYSKADIARISVGFGLIVSLVGGIVGGILSLRFGVMKILFIGAVTSALSNLVFVGLALQPGPSTSFLTAAIIADNLSGGLAVAAGVAFLSTLVSKEFSATQYAAFTSVTLLLPKLLAGYSGVMVDSMGYQGFFILTAVIGSPVIVLILCIWRPYQQLVKKL